MSEEKAFVSRKFGNNGSYDQAIPGPWKESKRQAKIHFDKAFFGTSNSRN
jgi:hypothetical protein